MGWVPKRLKCPSWCNTCGRLLLFWACLVGVCSELELVTYGFFTQQLDDWLAGWLAGWLVDGITTMARVWLQRCVVCIVGSVVWVPSCQKQ